jgi:hypothetical protein
MVGMDEIHPVVDLAVLNLLKLAFGISGHLLQRHCRLSWHRHLNGISPKANVKMPKLQNEVRCGAEIEPDYPAPPIREFGFPKY